MLKAEGLVSLTSSAQESSDNIRAGTSTSALALAQRLASTREIMVSSFMMKPVVHEHPGFRVWGSLCKHVSQQMHNEQSGGR